MASMTIRNIDEGVMQALTAQAERKGVPVEEEARRVLGEGVDRRSPEPETVEWALKVLRHPRDGKDVGSDFRLPPASNDREAEIRTLLSLSQPLSEPFDLKTFSDALSDGTE
jgi:plasmid stability protein